jgi:PAS domain S-box-containing protein
MNPDNLRGQLEVAQGRIKSLQDELSRTNSELLQLTLALDDQVAERTAELQESQHFLQTVFQSIRDGLCVVGMEGRIQQANGWLAELFPSGETIVGRFCHEVFCGPDRPCSVCALREVLDSGVPTSSLLPHPDQSIEGGWLEYSVFPHRNEWGNMTGVIVQLKDVTERERARSQAGRLQVELEERVALRTDELAAANRELEAFAYSVSHDLRAPLRAMDGFSQALLEDMAARLDTQGQDYLMRIRRASRKMSQLIDDLLALSRVTRRELRLARVDISELARESFQELSATAPDRQVEVTVEDGLWAMGDASLLRIALQNLVGNAWKYSSRTQKSEIAVTGGQDQTNSVFSVTDNGAGFDMALVGRLFAPFQRLHTDSQFEGSGIGLATVERIVRRHGGRIWAESSPGEGACFSVSLPRRGEGRAGHEGSP